MKTMLRYHNGALVLGLLLGASAADAKFRNFSVNSVNQPVVSANQAFVPNCPNWAASSIDSAAIPDTNDGCASNSNLAAMGADPMDLIHGKSDSTTDAHSVNRAIKAWREAETTFKQWQVTTKESAKGGGQ